MNFESFLGKKPEKNREIHSNTKDISQESTESISQESPENISQEDTESLEEEKGRALFGKTAILLKILTQEQVNDALLYSVTSHKGKKIGEILVEMGYLTFEQVEMILARQKTKMMYCPQCETKYQILLFQESKTYECKNCHAKLQIYKSKKMAEEEKKALRKISIVQRDRASETQSFRVMSQTSRLIGKSVSHTIQNLAAKIKKDEDSRRIPLLIEKKEEENPYKMDVYRL